MTSFLNSVAKAAIVATLSVAALAGATTTASARPHHGGTNGITTCAAPGQAQETGAVIGAVLGAVIGHQIQHNDTGTAVGAVVGAGVGAGVGCQIQHDNQDRREAAWNNGYESDGVAYSDYQPINRWMVADERTSLRQSPNRGAERLGSLEEGERFQAVGLVDGGRWILVADDGRLVGYVRGSDVENVPSGYAYSDY